MVFFAAAAAGGVFLRVLRRRRCRTRQRKSPVRRGALPLLTTGGYPAGANSRKIDSARTLARPRRTRARAEVRRRTSEKNREARRVSRRALGPKKNRAENYDHTFTEHQAGKIRNKLLREWAWSEVPTSEIDPAFRTLYKEHVGDRYGDAEDPRVPPTSHPTDAPLQRLGCGALVPSRDLR